MSYTKIKSNFIKNKLKGMKWNEKNRANIDELIDIENDILGMTNSLHTPFYLEAIKHHRKKEFIAIAKELKPKTFKKIIAQHEKDLAKLRKLMEKDAKKEPEELEREFKAEWKAAGGKILKNSRKFIKKKRKKNKVFNEDGWWIYRLLEKNGEMPLKTFIQICKEADLDGKDITGRLIELGLAYQPHISTIRAVT